MAAINYGDAAIRLLPHAEFWRSATYNDLVNTWQDVRPVPTEAELEAAWAEIEAEQAALQPVDLQAKVTELEGTIQTLQARIAALEGGTP